MPLLRIAGAQLLNLPIVIDNRQFGAGICCTAYNRWHKNDAKVSACVFLDLLLMEVDSGN
jgi:hypothetical protein